VRQAGGSAFDTLPARKPGTLNRFCWEDAKLRKLFADAVKARLAGARPIAISLLGLLCALAALNLRAAPLTVYGNLPSVENVALSPDGSRVA
jgi:hypothetical protein